jgi:MoaA/NifB/PqqE/SkfB family radical SAM enzyme
MNDRLADHAKLARTIGFEYVGVETNGRLLSVPSYQRVLSSLGLDEIIVRLNAGDEQVHDKMARAPKAFRQTVRGLLRLARQQTPYTVRVKRHTMNVSSLDTARQLAERVGARFEVKK